MTSNSTQQDIDLQNADALMNLHARCEELENAALERLRKEGRVETWVPTGVAAAFAREFEVWWDCDDDD